MNGEIGFSGVLSGDISAGGSGGEVPTIYADATVDNNTGTPTVTVTKSTTSTSNTFHFAFQNLKGEAGSQGSQGIPGVQGIQGPVGPQGPRGFTGQTGSAGPAGSDGYSPEVTVTSITGGHRVNITDESHPLGQNFDVMDGINGQDGSPGETGPEGPAGPGVATGGTTGQVLTKTGSGDYLTEWADPAIPDAADIPYDNTDSGLTADDVQGAIDENAGAIDTLNSSLTQKTDTSTALKCYRSVDTGIIIISSSVTFKTDGYTLNQTVPSGFRPVDRFNQLAKVYNGSSYVDCRISVYANGDVTITQLSGGAVSGIQVAYLTPNYVTYPC